MFSATCSILENVIKGSSNYSVHGGAIVACKKMASYDFIFLLHLMKEIMRIIDVFYQCLQQISRHSKCYAFSVKL